MAHNTSNVFFMFIVSFAFYDRFIFLKIIIDEDVWDAIDNEINEYRKRGNFIDICILEVFC